jgi:two-component system response regulator CpxR
LRLLGGLQKLAGGRKKSSSPPRGRRFGVQGMLVEFGLRAKGAAMDRWRKTLLCVDDNQGCLNIHKTILEDLGHTVLTASSGREGLKVFASNAIDAVLLDYQMPDMNGEMVAAGLRKINPGVPILMLSGYESLPESTLRLVDEFVPKGDSAEFLLLAIQQLLSRGEKRKPVRAVTRFRVAKQRLAQPYRTKLPPPFHAT